MTIVSLREAQANLSDLVHGLAPGDEVVIVEHNCAVARIVASSPRPEGASRQPGTLRGTVVNMAPDFDAPLDDFKEYME